MVPTPESFQNTQEEALASAAKVAEKSAIDKEHRLAAEDLSKVLGEKESSVETESVAASEAAEDPATVARRQAVEAIGRRSGEQSKTPAETAPTPESVTEATTEEVAQESNGPTPEQVEEALARGEPVQITEVERESPPAIEEEEMIIAANDNLDGETRANFDREQAIDAKALVEKLKLRKKEMEEKLAQIERVLPEVENAARQRAESDKILETVRDLAA